MEDKEKSEVVGGHPGPRCQHERSLRVGNEYRRSEYSLLGQEHRVEREVAGDMWVR